MRRLLVAALPALAVALAVALAPEAHAKFGVSKTRVTLPRLRPPAIPVIAETVAVEVKSGSPEVTGTHVSLVRSRLEEAVEASRLFRFVDGPREADAIVRVTLDDLRAEVRDEIEMEKKRVKIGEKQVWNEKKKRYETEDVYGDRDQPVSYRLAEGSLNAVVEVLHQGGKQTRDSGAAYRQRFKVESGVPSEASSEESLRRFLVQAGANDILAQVTYTPDPVEALLAVDGELKPGNRLAESALFEQALVEWSRRKLKGDTEAARLHNLGVAHEALAYRLPPHDPEHRTHLETAREHYQMALTMDPGEKYFKPPLERIEISLSYASTAAAHGADLERFREKRGTRRAKTETPRREEPSETRASAPKASPLRNGSFESSLAPWMLTGKGSLVDEAGRGRVLELAGAGGARVQQTVDVDIKGAAATLSLDYRVASGEGIVRALVSYDDGTGRTRTSTLEVTAGEGPGPWQSWTGDLAKLRPRPAHVTDVKVLVEGGTVRLDNVALTLK